MRIGTKFRFVFEKTKIERSMDRKVAIVLFRTGGYGKTVVRSTIRRPLKSGKISKPGEPPRSQTKVLRRTVEFEVNRIKAQVDIGAGIRRRARRKNIVSRKPVPQLLQEGGTVRRRKPEKVRNRRVRTRLRYRARPYVYNRESIIHAKWRENMQRVELK